jgi:uncharacterized integral membrane protein
MRILKTVILCLAFVAAVFLCSANVHSVQLHYIPDFGITQLGAPQSLDAPLFLVVLASVALGLVFGGGAALFEQTRVKLELRQAKKAEAKFREQAVTGVSELGVEREEVARLNAAISSLHRERDELVAAADQRASSERAEVESSAVPPAAAPPVEAEPPSNGDQVEEPDKT